MPAPRKYPDELRERAVRMVLEVRAETGTNRGAVVRVADQLGINKETLRGWVNQADVDHGRLPGLSTDDRQRVAELEAEVKDLDPDNATDAAPANTPSSPPRPSNRSTTRRTSP